MNPFAVRLQFRGNLGFFLRSKTGGGTVERSINEKTSVKDIIESCGIPHPEVDVILVNGQAVGPDHTLTNEADVEVFPVGYPGACQSQQHFQTPKITAFVCDGHLGKLARNLRLLGFDVAYDQRADDHQLLEVMAAQNRALLTRDRPLLMHAIVQHGYCPRSQNAEEQTVEVVRRFNLFDSIVPFTRCLRCNTSLEGVAKADIVNKLEPLTKIYYEQFRRCLGCGQIFWAGSHFQKLQNRVEKIRARCRDVAL